MQPMTLANMRANGVRSLAVHCGGRWCYHSAVLDVSAYPDSVPVVKFPIPEMMPVGTATLLTSR